MKRILPPLLLVAILALALEVLVRGEVLPAYLYPPPSQILAALGEFSSDIATAFLQTARASFAGWMLAILIALPLAALLSLSSWARRALYPIASFFQTVPIIAIAPLLVIWFGFGEPTVRASALIVSFFPILSSALVGLQATTEEGRELFAVWNATPIQIFWHLRLPQSLPILFSGFRISAGLSVVGAIVGEFIAGGGLGALIDSGRAQQRVDLVFACVLLSALLGLFFVGFVSATEKALARWRPYFRSP